MACLPTYKGVRYNSIRELKAAIFDLKSNLTPEQNKNINDLKDIEPAYANYTNEQIQSFIESKIPDSKVKYVVFRGNSNSRTNTKSKELGIFFTDDTNAANIYALNYKGDEFDDSVLQGIIKKFGLNPTIEEIKQEIDFFKKMGADEQSIDKSAKEYQDYIKNNKGNKQAALLNTKNPKSLTVKDWFDNYEEGKKLKENTDGLILKGGKQSDNRIYDSGENQIVVFEPSQITILNSPETIKEFEEFIQSDQNSNNSSETVNNKPTGTINVYWGQAESSTSTKMLSKEEKAWFREKFPNIEVLYDSLEKGVEAMIQNGKVIVSQSATNKSLYHEGFHIFLRATFKTEEEYTAALQKVKEELGNKTIRTQKGKKIVFIKASEATVFEIDEYLAEEYGVYRYSGEHYNFPTKTAKTILEKIWAYLSKIFGFSNKSHTQKLFQELDVAKPYKITRKELEKALPGVQYRLGQEVSIVDLEDFHIGFNEFLSSITKENPGEYYVNPENILTLDFSNRLRDYIALVDPVVSENFDALFEEYLSILSNLYVQAYDDFIEREDLQRQTSKNNIDFQERNGESATKRAGRAVNLFLMNITSLGERQAFKTLLHNQLESSVSPEHMVNKLVALSKNPAFKKSHESLDLVLDFFSNMNSKEMIVVYRDFYNTFAQSKTESSYIFVGNTASVVNSTLKQISHNIRNKWLAEAFAKARNPKNEYLEIIDGQVVFKKSTFDYISTKNLKSKWDTSTKSKTQMKKFFNQIGLPLSEEELELIGNSEEIREFIKHIPTTVKDNLAEGIEYTRLDTLFTGDGTGSSQLAGRIIPLMKMFEKSRPLETELSTLTQGGKSKFAISLSTAIHRRIASARAKIERDNTFQRVNTELFELIQADKVGNFTEFSGLSTSTGFSEDFDRLDATGQDYTTVEAMLNGNVIFPADGRKVIRTLNIRDSEYDVIAELKIRKEGKETVAIEKSLFAKRLERRLAVEMQDFISSRRSPMIFKNKTKNYAKGLFIFKDLDKSLNNQLFKDLKNVKITADSNKAVKEILNRHRPGIIKYAEEYQEKLLNNLQTRLEDVGILKQHTQKVTNKKTDKTRKVAKMKVFLNPISLVNHSLGIKGFSGYTQKEIDSFKSVTKGKLDPYFDLSSESPEDEIFLERVLRYISSNGYLQLLDTNALFLGGAASYAGATTIFKRNERASSPQMSNAIDSKTMQDLEDNYIRSPRKTGKDSKTGEYKRSSLTIITIKEPVKLSPLTGKNLEVADGFTWMGSEAYRDMRLHATRWHKDDEKLHQYNDQMLFIEGMRRNSKSLFYTVKNFNAIFKLHNNISEIKDFSPKYSGENIEVNSLKASNEIEKPHGLGAATYPNGSVVENHTMKTSVQPLTWLTHKNQPSLINLALDMWEGGIDLIQTESSNKGDYPIGKTGFAPEVVQYTPALGSFYYTPGTLLHKNLESYFASFPFQDFAIQQDPSAAGNSVTLSVQMNSLVMSGLISRLEDPSDTAKMKGLVQQANDILNHVRKRETIKLLEDLGITSDLKIPVENWKKVEKLLLDSVSNNHTPQSTKYAIKKLLDTENLVVPGMKYLNLDISLMGEKLSQIVTSMVQKRIISLQVPGAQLTQVPNTMYSRVLKIYEELGDDNTRTSKAEVMISFPKNLVSWLESSKYKTLDKFNEALASGHVPQHIVEILTEITANRIPTSGLNLIDSFKVVEFLHWTTGKVVVLPDGMTEKGGLDYDIDKMNTYFNHLDVVNGEIVSFFAEDINKEISNADLQKYYKILRRKYDDISNKIRTKSLTDIFNQKNKLTRREIQELFEEPLFKVLTDKISDSKVQDLIVKYNNIPEERKDLAPTELTILIEIFNNPEITAAMRPLVLDYSVKGLLYKDVLSNKYLFNSLQKIYDAFIRHPKNFKQLTTPLTMSVISDAIDRKKALQDYQEEDLQYYEDINDIRKVFDLATNMLQKERVSQATSDIGTSASSLSVSGILSSMGIQIESRVPSLFKDFKGAYTIGVEFLPGKLKSVIEALNQVLQAELEVTKTPDIAKVNIVGVTNRIFQTMLLVSPGSKQMAVESLVDFMASEEIIAITRKATVESSPLLVFKESHKNFKKSTSFTQILQDMAGEYGIYFEAEEDSSSLDVNKIKDIITELDLSFSDLLDPTWRQDNPQKLAAVLLFYTKLNRQVSLLSSNIYQDGSFASGSAELDMELFDREEFMKEGGTNKIWNLENLKVLNSKHRNKQVIETTEIINRFLMNSRAKGAHALVHKKLNQIKKSLPWSNQREKAVKKIDLYFLTYVLQNFSPEFTGYDTLLTDRFRKIIDKRKEKDPDNMIYSRLETSFQRIIGKTEKRVKTTDVTMSVGLRDVTEADLIHSELLKDPTFLRDLTVLSFSKSGFLFEYQGLSPLLVDDFTMELFAPAFVAFQEHIDMLSKQEEEEGQEGVVQAWLDKMENVIFSNIKVMYDRSMVSAINKVLTDADMIPSTSGLPIYALKKRGFHLRSYTESPLGVEEDVKLRRLTYAQAVQEITDRPIAADLDGYAMVPDPHSEESVLALFAPETVRGDATLLAFIDDLAYANYKIAGLVEGNKGTYALDQRKNIKTTTSRTNNKSAVENDVHYEVLPGKEGFSKWKKASQVKGVWASDYEYAIQKMNGVAVAFVKRMRGSKEAWEEAGKCKGG